VISLVDFETSAIPVRLPPLEQPGGKIEGSRVLIVRV